MTNPVFLRHELFEIPADLALAAIDNETRLLNYFFADNYQVLCKEICIMAEDRFENKVIRSENAEFLLALYELHTASQEMGDGHHFTVAVLLEHLEKLRDKFELKPQEQKTHRNSFEGRADLNLPYLLKTNCVDSLHRMIELLKNPHLTTTFVDSLLEQDEWRRAYEGLQRHFTKAWAEIKRMMKDNAVKRHLPHLERVKEYIDTCLEQTNDWENRLKELQRAILRISRATPPEEEKQVVEEKVKNKKEDKARRGSFWQTFSKKWLEDKELEDIVEIEETQEELVIVTRKPATFSFLRKSYEEMTLAEMKTALVGGSGTTPPEFPLLTFILKTLKDLEKLKLFIRFPYYFDDVQAEAPKLADPKAKAPKAQLTYKRVQEIYGYRYFHLAFNLRIKALLEGMRFLIAILEKKRQPKSYKEAYAKAFDEIHEKYQALAAEDQDSETKDSEQLTPYNKTDEETEKTSLDSHLEKIATLQDRQDEFLGLCSTIEELINNLARERGLYQEEEEEKEAVADLVDLGEVSLQLSLPTPSSTAVSLAKLLREESLKSEDEQTLVPYEGEEKEEEEADNDNEYLLNSDFHDDVIFTPRSEAPEQPSLNSRHRPRRFSFGGLMTSFKAEALDEEGEEDNEKDQATSPSLSP